MPKKCILQLMGPTGVGKSGTALKLAEHFNGEIISADSMQVYRNFDIGTDKIQKADRKGIPHYLIDIIDNCSQFNAANFLHQAHEISEKIIDSGKLPIVCGGTPLYHRVIFKGLFPDKKSRPEFREKLKKEIALSGSELYWDKLNKIDPDYAQKISKNDKVRIVRALEIFDANQIKPSELFKKNYSPFQDYLLIRIVLNLPRELLYERIEKRVDQMIERGLENEVIELKKKYPVSCPPFKSLGYKEMLMYMDGECGIERAIDLIKQHSRNYAKRQLTWFRSEAECHWFSPYEFDKIAEFIEKKLAV